MSGLRERPVAMRSVLEDQLKLAVGELSSAIVAGLEECAQSKHKSDEAYSLFAQT